MVDENRQGVPSRTRRENWLLIIGRVLVGFGIGILTMRYFPGFATYAVLPAIFIGVVLFALAAFGVGKNSREDA